MVCGFQWETIEVVRCSLELPEYEASEVSLTVFFLLYSLISLLIFSSFSLSLMFSLLSSPSSFLQDLISTLCSFLAAAFSVSLLVLNSSSFMFNWLEILDLSFKGSHHKKKEKFGKNSLMGGGG